MPVPYVKKLAKKHGTSVKESEEKWDDAKKAAEKQGQGENYAYRTSIYQKMMHEKSTPLPRILARLEKAVHNMGNLTSPFQGGKKTKSITTRHVPLMWENMLGTVYARLPQARTEDDTQYFDYNWIDARKYAQLDQCSDLRIVRCPKSYGEPEMPRKGQWVLWGIPPVTDQATKA